LHEKREYQKNERIPTSSADRSSKKHSIELGATSIVCALTMLMRDEEQSRSAVTARAYKRGIGGMLHDELVALELLLEDLERESECRPFEDVQLDAGSDEGRKEDDEDPIGRDEMSIFMKENTGNSLKMVLSPLLLLIVR
jgi:hypothetical protein